MEKVKSEGENIWAERFMNLDKSEIRKASKFIPKRVRGLDNEHVDKACGKLEKVLNELFIPTDQTVYIMSSLIGAAISHNYSVYDDKNHYVKGIYAKDPPLPPFVFPICLTGLGGVGKSSLINAFRRVLPEDEIFYADEYHPHNVMKSVWYLNITEKTKLSTMLLSLLESDTEQEDGEKKKHKGRTDIEKLRNRGRHRAYMTGVSLLLADELQFISRSQNANALITNIIMNLFSLGIPGIYSVNYSLVHRLLLRPQEDRNRLLSNIKILFPDDPNSIDWIETLKGYKKILPSIYCFDPVADAVYLYKMTAGIKRYLKKLFLIAYRRYRENKKNIYIFDLEIAFNSQDYAIERDDIKHLSEYYLTNKCARKDLVCPIKPPETLSQLYKDLAKEENMKNLVTSVIESFMTKEEKIVYKKLQKAALSGNAKIIPLTKKRAKVINDYSKGEELLQNSLKDKKKKDDKN